MKLVSDIKYNVIGGTLNLAQLINQWCSFANVLPVSGIDERWVWIFHHTVQRCRRDGSTCQSGRYCVDRGSFSRHRRASGRPRAGRCEALSFSQVTLSSVTRLVSTPICTELSYQCRHQIAPLGVKRKAASVRWKPFPAGTASHTKDQPHTSS